MVELLAIVEAEQSAEALLKDAKERHDQAIEQALLDREFKLGNLKPPIVTPPTIKPAKPNLEKVRDLAQKNKRRAIAVILEELYAS